MKALFTTSLSLLITLSSFGAAQANEQKPTNYLDSQLSSDLLDVNYVSRQPYTVSNNNKDTITAQTKVLEKINEALTRGAITPDQASDLKDQLNGIGASESWYKSIAVPVPQTVLKENTEKLAALNTQIDKQLPLHLSRVITSTGGTTYGEISKLIGHAAVSNKISNAQAEQYYTQLTQIENDAESLKNDPASSKVELSDLNSQLKLLKADIQAKLNK